MNYSILYRILLYIVIFFTIIFGWWFVAVPLLVIGIWKFSFGVEILIAGIVYDALFGMLPSMGIWGYVGTISALLILALRIVLRKMIR